MTFDEPWERAAAFHTIIKDGDVYRMYYRGMSATGKGEYTCYAESADGIKWTKPKLGLHAAAGRNDTNIILPDDKRRTGHNFAPMLDTRPGVPQEERFKAVAGKGPSGKPAPGLYRYVSADGIHWRAWTDEPLLAGYALDSLNVPVWLPEEQCYAIYMRMWSEGGGPPEKFKGIRTIGRATSKDFKTWTRPQRMTFGDTPPEHLYTNNTQPYFRAPHLLISLPFRLWPGRRAYAPEMQAEWGVPAAHAKGVSDAVFMSSRGGLVYDRVFMESFIRPGPDRLAWHARETQPSNGVVPTGPGEMSFYVINHYPMPSQHLTRYVLRTDGFASLHAGYKEGSMLTKPLTYSGEKLMLNMSTSAAGKIIVEIIGDDGLVLMKSKEIIGDEIARAVEWQKKGDVGSLAGNPVRLRFTLKDADLYSFRFSK